MKYFMCVANDWNNLPITYVKWVRLNKYDSQIRHIEWKRLFLGSDDI